MKGVFSSLKNSFSALFVLCMALVSFGQTNPTKVAGDFGNKFDRCPNSTETFWVIYKNPNPYPIDIVVYLKETSGEWKATYKYNMASGDTILAYTCKGAGNAQKDFRKSGVQLPLMGYEEANTDYLKEHPKPVATPTVDAADLVDFKAKLMTGEKTKNPIVNRKVELKDEKGVVLRTTTTNEHGDFTFEKVNSKQNTSLSVEDNPPLAKGEKMYLAKTNGTIISEMVKDASNNFVYKMLPQEFKKLSMMEVEDVDPFLALKSFSASQGKDLVIADNVYFSAGSSELLPEAKMKLDKVVTTLNENKNLSVELSAHTDSKGDDASNLKLSEERAKLSVQYIVSKGIDAKRISGKGYGETKLLNRCANGVNCSEEEHKLNRRVEFKFIKN